MSSPLHVLRLIVLFHTAHLSMQGSRDIQCNTTAKADIVLLVDGSSSIGRQNFKTIRSFIARMVGVFNIGPDRVQIGLVQYSDDPKTEWHLNAHRTRQELLDAVANLKYKMGSTWTGTALNYILQNNFKRNVGLRPDARKIGVLITDGKSDDEIDQMSAKLQIKDIELYAIGVKNADENELRSIASDPDEIHMYNVENFSFLLDIVDNLAVNLCNSIKASVTLGPCEDPALLPALRKMEDLSKNLAYNSYEYNTREFENLEKVLENTEFSEDVSCTAGNIVMHLYKASGNFTGLNISANEMKASSSKGGVNNTSVHVHLPKTLLNPKEKRTIVFCMITAPDMFKNYTVLYGRAVGVSISDRKVTGLTDRINITFSLRDPSPLQVNPETSERDQNILTYITLIGCSFSLLFLVATLFMYIRDRKSLADASPKIHLNLAVALIMLNVHFLPSQLIASLPISGPCIYLAVMLHYSLLATFTWTAIEGFHLYLLLVRVFNIYIKRYLLKLGLVGWGVPAVVVAIILIIDRDIYQRVTFHTTDNSTATAQICYLQDGTVKLFNLAFCGLVWASSLLMLALTCRLMLALQRDRMPAGKSRVWKDVCAILGISCLLGITWGLVFVSFGPLPTTPALYLFCILNSLQGFFVALWMCVSKQRSCPAPSSQRTKSTDTQNKDMLQQAPGSQGGWGGQGAQEAGHTKKTASTAL